jgi:hypothetical protein
MMRKMIIAALSGLLTGITIAPAFAAPNVPNCNDLPRRDFANCVIEQSQERGSQ